MRAYSSQTISGTGVLTASQDPDFIGIHLARPTKFAVSLRKAMSLSPFRTTTNENERTSVLTFELRIDEATELRDQLTKHIDGVNDEPR